jgi:hypothetical protein
MNMLASVTAEIGIRKSPRAPPRHHDAVVTESVMFVMAGIGSLLALWSARSWIISGLTVPKWRPGADSFFGCDCFGIYPPARPPTSILSALHGELAGSHGRDPDRGHFRR